MLSDDDRLLLFRSTRSKEIPLRPHRPERYPREDARYWYDKEYAGWGIDKLAMPESPCDGPRGKRIAFLQPGTHPYHVAFAEGLARIAEKRQHIRSLLADAGIAGLWKAATGADPGPADVDSLYEELEPRLVTAVKRHSGLVPGTKELADELRSWGIKIGSTTGYLRLLMDILTAEASRQGFTTDAVVCPSDVPAGRPYPWMCFLNAIKLEVFPPRRIVKVGDTRADILEGLNAGMWTVGVTLCGNEMGLSPAEVDRLSADERAGRLQGAEKRLREAGAHYVTESVATCRDILARIEERIMRGEQPSREKVHERA